MWASISGFEAYVYCLEFGCMVTNIIPYNQDQSGLKLYLELVQYSVL